MVADGAIPEACMGERSVPSGFNGVGKMIIAETSEGHCKWIVGEALASGEDFGYVSCGRCLWTGTAS